MIRPYNNSDKEQLVEIFKLNTPQYFAPEELNDFLEYLEVNSETYLIIEAENKIAGGVGYEIRESDKSGRVNWIFIHPLYSGIGLGKEAIDHCIRILKSNPVVEILIVRTSQHAFRFFEKCGYKLVETKKDYWAPGLDLYLMEQRITKVDDSTT